MNYNKTIKRLCRSKGITLKDLKLKAGLGANTVIGYPTKKSLIKILCALNISTDQFFLELIVDSSRNCNTRYELQELINKKFKSK